MTREENRKIIESLQPLIELVMESLGEMGIDRVNIHASRDDRGYYGCLDVGDYEIVYIDEKMTLNYRPLGNVQDWETEKILPSGHPGEEA